MEANNFIVSARKYRPVTFDTVVGQSAVTNTLKNAIKSNRLGQAYLFCGPRGVGKTTCARILAKTLNCFHPTPNIEACDQCESCKSFNESRSYNIHELDAASNNSVDDIRNLIDQVRIPPQVGKYSIYIIDEVHMLSAAAFNAFLKTLEEPPAHALFILATTEKHKIIPTILSRCQIYDFNRIKIDDAVLYLEKISKNEGITYDAEGLRVIAQKADGAMRDALSIYDQIVSFCGSSITYKSVIENLNMLSYEYFFSLTDAFLDHSFGQAFIIFDEILNKGFDGHNFIASLSSHFRDLLVCTDPVTLSLLEAGADIRERYREQAARCGTGFLFEALNICNSCDINYKISKNQRLHVELALLHLCETGVEKKKSDPVAVADSQNKPVVKPAARPIIPSISIKQAMAGYTDPKANPVAKTESPAVAETAVPSVSPPSAKADNRPVTQEAMTAAWNSFAETLKIEDTRLFSTLTTHAPSMENETKIIFPVSNQLQKEALQRIEPKLLQHLRTALNSENMEIELTKTAETAKAYTAEDIFAQMTGKNPVLTAFRQQLALDFE